MQIDFSYRLVFAPDSSPDFFVVVSAVGEGGFPQGDRHVLLFEVAVVAGLDLVFRLRSVYRTDAVGGNLAVLQ
ncbi:hypothetical protein MXD63_44720, partial [Frankia sp. Cpl3]|nr:hypothetical protein [Frankia sp. Cpl3]